MSDQLQRKLKSLYHARRQMTEMTYLLERTIHEYIAYDTDCKKNHLMFEGYKLSSICLLYTSPSPRDKRQSRMPSSA